MYRQTLMAGLRAATRKPTNLAKVNLVRQEPNESLAAFLERLMEVFRQYTPMDPQANESRTAIMLAFVNWAAPDIRRKLQKIERLGEQSIQDLVRAAERVFNHRETPEERKERVRQKESQKELAQIFFAGVRQGADSQGTNEVRPRDEGKQVRQRLRKDQCAYCQERGHWRRECPKRKPGEKSTREEAPSLGAHVLYAGDDSD